MRPNSGVLILLSASARAHAQDAARGTRALVAIDGYGDADLAAGRRFRLPLEDGQFPPRRTAALLARLAGPGTEFAYGSGLEAHPELLDALPPGIVLRGNGAAALRRCADPLELAAALDRIGAPHPEVRAAPPAESAGWLSKRAGRSGGAHVRPAAAADRARPGLRWQRRAEGEAWSALFLAAGGEARVLGCCRLLPAAAGAPPYAWSGAVGPLPAPAGVAEQVQWLARALARALDLRGVNGMDFLIDPARRVLPLDLNPRLTATCELYAARLPGGYLRAHLEACAGRLPAATRPAAGVGGLQVVYAPRRLAAARTERDWPPEAADRPRPGAPVAAGEPLCTVRGRWSDYAAARAGLRRSGARVLAALGAAPAGSEAHV